MVAMMVAVKRSSMGYSGRRYDEATQRWGEWRSEFCKEEKTFLEIKKMR